MTYGNRPGVCLGLLLTILLTILLPASSFAQDAPASPAAAASAASSPASPGGPAAQTPPGFVQFLPLIAIGLMFYFILLRPQQKQQQQRKQILQALKKHDKVVTNGGMIGTISELSSDGRFVTLKVDDNTRIRFLRSSVHGLLEEKPET